MGETDKVKNKAEEIEGRAKQAAGAVAADSHLRREGRAEEAKSNLKQAGEKVKDAFRKKKK